jgi:hypothetical protein
VQPPDGRSLRRRRGWNAKGRSSAIGELYRQVVWNPGSALGLLGGEGGDLFFFRNSTAASLLSLSPGGPRRYCVPDAVTATGMGGTPSKRTCTTRVVSIRRSVCPATSQTKPISRSAPARLQARIRLTAGSFMSGRIVSKCFRLSKSPSGAGDERPGALVRGTQTA